VLKAAVVLGGGGVELCHVGWSPHLLAISIMRCRVTHRRCLMMIAV
jgi:hypothetical protein